MLTPFPPPPASASEFIRGDCFAFTNSQRQRWHNWKCCVLVKIDGNFYMIAPPPLMTIMKSWFLPLLKTRLSIRFSIRKLPKEEIAWFNFIPDWNSHAFDEIRGQRILQSSNILVSSIDHFFTRASDILPDESWTAPACAHLPPAVFLLAQVARKCQYPLQEENMFCRNQHRKRNPDKEAVILQMQIKTHDATTDARCTYLTEKNECLPAFSEEQRCQYICQPPQPTTQIFLI